MVLQQIVPEGEIKLIPESDTSFYFEDENDRRIVFSSDAHIKIISSSVIASGVEHKMGRKK